MSRSPAALALVSVLLLSGLAMAGWVPDAGDWSQFRRTADHQALAGLPGLFVFTGQPGDLRTKWARATGPTDPSYWVPPVAADLDNDGIAEVLAPIGNASANPSSPTAPVQLAGGFEVLNGRTGALLWKVGPVSGNLEFFGPAVGDLDGDAFAEVVFFQGNPVAGTAATNRFVAYEHTGAQKWTFSDSTWGSKTAEPLTAVAIGNVDGDPGNEVVMNMLLTNVVTRVEQNQAPCTGGRVNITGSNPEHRVYALNGENGQVSWSRTLDRGSASSAAIGDLNADGKNEVVFGSGVKPGAFLSSCSAVVWLDAAFADDKFRAIDGASPPDLLWERPIAGHFPGDAASGPLLVDVDLDGDRDMVQPLWVRTLPPTTAETSVLAALDGPTGAVLWLAPIGAASLPLAASGDLDGLPGPELVVQTDNGGAADSFRVVAFHGDGSRYWTGPSLGRSMSSAPAIGDVTGDGAHEVAVITTPGSGSNAFLRILSGQTGALLHSQDLGRIISTGGPVLADLDGDDGGKLEVLVNTGAWGSPGRIFALEPNARPVCDFGFPAAPTEAAPGVPFTDLTTDADDGVAATFLWTFGDGTSSSARNPVHAFPDQGTFTVTLVATDPHGGACSVAKSVEVGAVPPQAAFQPRVVRFKTVQFDDRSTHPNPSDAPPAGWTYAWTFLDTDGVTILGTSALRNPEFEFPAEAVYDVVLKVTDNDGLDHTIVAAVNSANKAPVPAFSFMPAKPIAGFPVRFQDASTDEDGTVRAWSWDFGDLSRSSQRNPVHTYNRGGDYTVRLTVTDDQGATASTSRVIHVCETGARLINPGPGVQVEVCYHVGV